MALVTGNDGIVKYGATPTALPTESWAISEKGSVRNGDSSSNAGDYTVKSAGAFKDWSGSFVALLDDGEDGPAVGTAMAGLFYIDDTKYYGGQIIITDRNPAVEVKGGDYAKVNFTFDGTGDLHHPNDA
jgi:hypothetical protein